MQYLINSNRKLASWNMQLYESSVRSNHLLIIIFGGMPQVLNLIKLIV